MVRNAKDVGNLEACLVEIWKKQEQIKVYCFSIICHGATFGVMMNLWSRSHKYNPVSDVHQETFKSSPQYAS